MKNFNKMNKLCLFQLMLFALNLHIEYNSAAFAGSITYDDEDTDRIMSQNRDKSDFVGGDQVIKTVVNISDTNASSVLNNFNVSLDEILRRISAPPPSVTESFTDLDGNTTNEEREAGKK